MFADQALEHIRNLPGIENAGLVSAMPFLPAYIVIKGGFRVEGRLAQQANEQPNTHLSVATGDPTLPFYDVATVDGLVSQSLAPRRSIMQRLDGLAALAFVLAAA